MKQYILLSVCLYQYIPVCASTYQYILVHTSMYYNFLHRNPSLTRRWIQGGTWQYMSVPKSPVPLNRTVQGSTWRYKALFLDVLPCTVLFRGTELLGTDMYCHVPFCIHFSTRQYEPVWGNRVNAGMYQYVLVHTIMYSTMHTSMYSYH